jgi:dTDP-glucose 4,6-dehydratase/UDP-glucuronate decarboxylase
LRPPRSDVEEVLERATADLRGLGGSRLLVTGAAGFIAAHLCEVVAAANDSLLARPIRLRCVDNFVTGVPERLAALAERPDVELVRASVTELDELGADLVVHAASIASPPAYRAHPIETIEVNVLGTWRLLRLAGTTSARVLHLSSSEVYGDPDPDEIPTSEDYIGRVSFTGPRACYDESKRVSETLCRLYAQVHGVTVVTARPFNVYGPTLRLDDGRVLPDLVRRALAGETLVLHSDGRPTRSFCYITDALTAFVALLVRGIAGEAYNVGTPEEVTIEELARRVARTFGVDGIRHESAADPAYLTDNPQRRCPDITKIRTLGWEPRVTLDEGLARVAAFHRAAV